MGRDMSPGAYLDAAQNEKAYIIAMSSLMTTTRPSAHGMISLFDEVNLRQQFIV